MIAAPFCICIPARNEAARLPRLLDALAAQDVEGPISIALCINNSDDGSAEIARAAGRRFEGRLDLSINESTFPRALAHAGSARRQAMNVGLDRCGAVADAILLSTDADCRPPPDWISANLAAFAQGATLVGGRIVLDPDEPLDPSVLKYRTLWDDYWQEVRAIEDTIDPVPWDPAPRHGDHTGASLATTCDLYQAAGGVPAIALGEDRALVANAIAAGGRLAHPMSVWTFVSPRAQGRANGGMADDMQRLSADAARGASPMAPAFAHWHARAAWRRTVRQQPGGHHILALKEGALAPMPLDMRLGETAS